MEPAAIVLHTTFLGIRWLTSFESWRERSAWLGRVGCPLIALPQDDFDHAAILDEWLEELGATRVLTALPDHVDVLYPRTGRRARIVRALTGYVSPSLARRSAVSLDARPMPLVYRATALPYWFGRLGRLKEEVGIAVARAVERIGLTADVSLRPGDAVTGGEWLGFLESGRAVAGAESGSSVIDPDGSVRRAVEQLLAVEPGLSYGEVVARLPEFAWDERWLSSLSPRHLEAAAMRTPQLLVEGAYSGILVPDRHYVPIARDLSDVDAALERVLDPEVGGAIAEQAHAELVASADYASERLTEAVLAGLPADDGLRAPSASLAAVRIATRAWNAYAEVRAGASRLRSRRA
jgi:hypothetical protein